MDESLNIKVEEIGKIERLMENLELLDLSNQVGALIWLHDINNLLHLSLTDLNMEWVLAQFKKAGYSPVDHDFESKLNLGGKTHLQSIGVLEKVQSLQVIQAKLIEYILYLMKEKINTNPPLYLCIEYLSMLINPTIFVSIYCPGVVASTRSKIPFGQPPYSVWLE